MAGKIPEHPGLLQSGSGWQQRQRDAQTYSGLRQTNPFHVGVSATGSGSLASSGALTTAASSELLFAAGMTGAVFTAPGSGFTSRIVTSPDGDLVPQWRPAP